MKELAFMQTEHINNSAGRQPHPGAFNPDGAPVAINHGGRFPGYVWVKPRKRDLHFYLLLADADGNPHWPGRPVVGLSGHHGGRTWVWLVSGAWGDIRPKREQQHYFDGRADSASEAIAQIKKAHDEFFSRSPKVIKNIAAALAARRKTPTAEDRAFWQAQQAKREEFARAERARFLRRRRRRHPAFAQMRLLSAAILQNNTGRATAAAAKIAAEFGGQPGAES